MSTGSAESLDERGLRVATDGATGRRRGASRRDAESR